LNRFTPTYPGSRLAGLVINDAPKPERVSRPKPHPALSKLGRKDWLILGALSSASLLGEIPSQEELAASLGMPRRTYRWHLERLVALGMVEMVPATVKVHVEKREVA
jgi:DNA-binding transcriptional ArsR family regulator